MVLFLLKVVRVVFFVQNQEKNQRIINKETLQNCVKLRVKMKSETNRINEKSLTINLLEAFE